MENVTEAIKDYLQSNGYRITEIDDDGIISVRYQMNLIHICPSSNDNEFISMMLPGIDEVDPENPLPTIVCCMKVVTHQMVVKTYPIGKDNVAATYEFFFKGEEDLKFQIEKGFDSLIAAKVKYRKLKEAGDN